MPPELLRSGLRLGMLVLILAAVTLPFLNPSTSEFWASLIAVLVAVVFIGGLVVLLSTSHQSPPRKG
jgi:hypothetical protein